ncbi:MAG: hypothetical protein DMG78_25070 [Acidobacteria bacterium]|nr:MAG: hypothetical protein DMG78_25070 [Acidobacteriota bacterium]
MKRTIQVNVKMTEEDFALLRKAAEERWRDAAMTYSGIVLALDRIAARDILAQKSLPPWFPSHKAVACSPQCVIPPNRLRELVFCPAARFVSAVAASILEIG